MILSVNYTHSSSLVHYILLAPDGTVIYDNIISSGAQSITLSNSLLSGNYTLYSMDPYDMTKVAQETVVIPNCIPASPSVTPSVTPSTTQGPPGSASVTPSPSSSIPVSLSPTVTPTATPSPSPVYSTTVTITKYAQVEGGGSIEVWNTNNVKILSKNTSELSVGGNTFTLTPYSGPYTIYLTNIYKIGSTPAYTAITSNTGEYKTSTYGSMSVSGYGTLSSGISTIGITLGQSY